MAEGRLTGGCQCGAVRFSVEAVGSSTICHCRMCQKAFGSAFAPLASAEGLVWTRGEPKRWASSDKALRGFCANCGTPLTFEDKDGVEVAVGAFDEPQRAAPRRQVNPQNMLPFFEGLHALPVRHELSPEQQKFQAELVNHQHPDHDTAEWQPRAAL